MMTRSSLERAVAIGALVSIVVATSIAMQSSSHPHTETAGVNVVESLPDLERNPDAPPAGFTPPPAVVARVDYDPQRVDRRIILQVESNFDPETLVNDKGVLPGGAVLEKMAALGGLVVVKIPEGLTANEAVMVAASVDGVVSAEADGLTEPPSPGSQLSPSSWALNRIDQPTLPVDGVYNYRGQGAGVRVYSLDTGLRASHQDFFTGATSRVAAGYSVIDDGRGTDEEKCLDVPGNAYVGHGTSTASIVAGTVFGVAKGTTIVPVRGYDCFGQGTWAGFISGVNWVVANHPAGVPGVLQIATQGGPSASFEAAVEAAVVVGITAVTAAGNSNSDTCTNSSPGRAASVITVGATDISDVRASYSNFGPCVDLFAPGEGSTTAKANSDVAVGVFSGTSASHAYVAGYAAILLGENPALSPAQVQTEINNAATTGVVSNPGEGTPNRVLLTNPNIPASADTAASGYRVITNATHSFSTTPGTPAVIYKREITNNSQTATLALNVGENTVGSAIISPDGTTGYFALNATPTKIVKVNLTNMTRIGDLTLHPTENHTHAAIISNDGAWGYFATGDSPAKIVSVNLANMTRSGGFALSYSDGAPRSAARVSASRAVFGTNSSPAKVVAVLLGSGGSALITDALTLAVGENDLRAAAAIPGSPVVVFGTNTAPGKVIQVSLGAGSLKTEGSTFTFTAGQGNDNLVGASASASNVYFTTGITPGRIINFPINASG